MAYTLAANVLDAIDGAGAAACSRYVVYFFWQWLEILGLRPDLAFCSSCACEVKRDAVLWYSAGKEALFCENCLRGQETGFLFRVGPGARLWLKETESLPAGALARVSLDGPSLEQAKALSEAILAGVLGKRLPTWEEI